MKEHAESPIVTVFAAAVERGKGFFFLLGFRFIPCYVFILIGGINHMPSAKVLEQKQAIVSTLAQRLQEASAGVIVSYAGINVEDYTKMRKELREAGVEYTVMKNTMIKRACSQVGLDGLNSVLEGTTAIATSADAVAPAKVLKKYADKIETFEIKAGFVDGNVLDRAGVLELADIPSRETLLARFLGSVQSSLYNFAYGLQAIVDKGDTESAEAPAEDAQEAAAPQTEASAEEAPAADDAQ